MSPGIGYDREKIREAATFIVAASDSLHKERADYVCDGLDDQVQIQAALDALPTTGGEVLLLDGTFNIEVALVLDSYQTLRGCGRNTILTTTTANVDIITATGGAGTEKIGIVIAALCIDGTAGGVVSDIGILWTYVDESKILNTWVQNNGEEGIQLSNCDNNRIASNIIKGNIWDGIYLNTSTYTVVNANVIDNNTSSAIYLDSSANHNDVTGNTCTGTQTGIYLTSVDYNNITGNICQGNSVYGIYLSSSDGNTISSNTIQNGKKGIYLNASLNNTITSNTINENSDIAIHVEGASSYNTISNNTCNGNNLDGILVTASSLNNTISDNTIQNNSYGIQIDNTAHQNTITGNNCSGNTNEGIYINNCNYCTVTGNTCNGNVTHGIYIYGIGNTISGNTCEGNSEYGIYIEYATHCTIIGNTCFANSQGLTNTKDDIYIDSSDYNNIQGNTCRAGALANKPRYGINIRNAACDGNLVINNDLYDDGFGTGAFNDAGTLTIVQDDNKGIAPFQVKHLIYAQNTSGGNLTVGNVVSYEAAASAVGFHSPTAIGDPLTWGMLAQNINNNAFGYIQVLGGTALLDATNAGGGAIAIGDLLCTEVGSRARKAAPGHIAFAIAMEACDAANCAINALIITPRYVP